MKSVMNHSFSQVPSTTTPRSSFNRSHGYKTTLDAGQLIPVFVDLALPGDTFNLRMTSFGRLATPIVPVMDNMFCDSFFFAVPIRLIWDNFQKFMGEQVDPGDSTDYLVPEMSAPAVTGHLVGSLSDYFGIPTGVPNLVHSSLWHRAYNLIWNEWFRDQNLQDSIVVDRDDGPDSPTDYVIKPRGKRHDYFTSCLPWPQKGPSVTLPLGTSAPVYGENPTSTGGYSLYAAWNSTTASAQWLAVDKSAGAQTLRYPGSTAGHTIGGNTLAPPEAYAADPLANPPYADLTNATAATINALREAATLQQFYEKDARGGTRYTEIIRSHFGVISPDARLQRPEYLGGGSTQINIHPIAQTSSTDATTPQGNLAAMGTVSASGHGFQKSFTEHCVIIGMVAVRADLNYQQGLNRMFSYRTRSDFYWPTFANLGEQPVLNKEIYAQGTSADEDVFGYNERYSELRFKPSVITGQFRSTYSASLDIWHLAQEFSSLPTLNNAFIIDNPPLDRVIATPTEPHFLWDSYFDLKCARRMPMYSVPGITRL